MNQRDRHDLQRWLDGTFEAEERAAFERRIDEDPELRAELQVHEQVGESIRRSHSVPEINAPAPAAPAAPPRWPFFVAGAASAAAVLLVWLQPWANRTELMRMAVGRSWLAVCEQPDPRPAEPACASPGQVPQYVQPLAPELPSPLVWRDAEGVRFERGLEPRPPNGLRVLALSVLPQTDVFLFVVPAATDPRPALPPDTDWNLFRKTCGALVVYELTPLEKPHGLQCLAAG